LCINYANEKLQQLFNQHIFQQEQDEYEAEGIDWITIEFNNNHECVELLEKVRLLLRLPQRVVVAVPAWVWAAAEVRRVS
jgi:myosin heavy subunit